MDFSKRTERPLRTITSPRRENGSTETSGRPGRKSWCRLQKQQSKFCAFLGGIGLLLIIMGCIVLVEKTRINSLSEMMRNNNDNQYLQITANVLLVIGISFVTFSVTLALYYFFKSCKSPTGSCSEEDGDNNIGNARVFSDFSGYVISQNCSTFSALHSEQERVCSVFTISDALGDPPKYCDLTTDDYPPPPKYYEPNKAMFEANEQERNSSNEPG